VDYASLSDTDLVAAIHTLVAQLAQARAAGNAALVQSLYGQFRLAAQEYDNRDTVSGLTDFLNTVQQNTEQFLQSLLTVPAAIGDAAGKGLWATIQPLLPVILLGLVAIIVLVYVAGKGGAVRIRAVA